jgi:DNA replication protein DnaC
LLRKGWPQLSGDFQRTIKRLKNLSQIVEKEAEAARMRLEGERHAEVLSVMKAFGGSPKKDTLPCYCLPLSLNEKLIGREDELKRVADALDPQEGNPQSRSLALYGMGGVGKTTIARQYANNARDRYEVIFWISADNMAKMTQSFLEVAQKLELVPENRKTEDAATAMAKVKSWLAETSELSNFDKKSFELTPVQAVVGCLFSTMQTTWRS